MCFQFCHRINLTAFVKSGKALTTGRGAATKREGGGACDVLPPRKGGGGQKKF